jgi:hypothetical protein
MGHALLDDLAERLEGGEKAKVGGPISWNEGDAEALIYAMVCQAVTHDTSTVAREVKPLRVLPGATRWDVEVQRRSGPPFSHGMAAASALAIFTNTEGELASYSWTDCVHLHSHSGSGAIPSRMPEPEPHG